MSVRRGNRSISVKTEIWYLVRFIQDDVFYVCPEPRIKFSDDRVLGKWPADGKWYDIKICDTGDKTSMQAAKNELEKNFKLVMKENKIGELYAPYKPADQRNPSQEETVNDVSEVTMDKNNTLEITNLWVGDSNLEEYGVTSSIVNDVCADIADGSQCNKILYTVKEWQTPSIRPNDSINTSQEKVAAEQPTIDTRYKSNLGIDENNILAASHVGNICSDIADNSDAEKTYHTLVPIINDKPTSTPRTRISYTDFFSNSDNEPFSSSTNEYEPSTTLTTTDEYSNKSTNSVLTQSITELISTSNQQNQLICSSQNLDVRCLKITSNCTTENMFEESTSKFAQHNLSTTSSNLFTECQSSTSKSTVESETTFNETRENKKITQKKVQVATLVTLKGEPRKWDKRFNCIYCRKQFAKLPRHWYKSHAEETEVAKILALPKKSAKRNILISTLQGRGAFLKNADAVKTNNGIVVPKRRPPSGKELDVQDFVPCRFCYQLFHKLYVSQHHKICPVKQENDSDLFKNKNIRSANSMMLPFGPDVSKQFRDKILSKMNHDKIFQIIRADQLILLYGETEFSRLAHEDRYHRTIVDRCRELGRLVITATSINPEITKLVHLMNASRYQLLKESVRKITGYSEEKNAFKIPSLVLKIGISIKKCAVLLKGDYLEDDILRLQIPDLDNFLAVIESKWSRELSTHAHRTLLERKWNNPKSLPVVKDLQLLHKYIENVIDQSLNDLKTSSQLGSYQNLTEASLVQTLILNRRRVGEMQFMLLKDFSKAKSANTEADIFQTLSPAEQALSKSLMRLVLKGKKGRGVPVLLTEKLISCINVLVETRAEVGIANDNVYLFPSTKHASGHYRADVLLKKFATEAGCNNVGAITSTRLRKHVATLTQLMNLKENELDVFANFLGHDITTHRPFYRLPDDTLQLAKISKIMLIFEKGDLNSLKGKSLDEIEIDDIIRDVENEIPEDDDVAVDVDAKENLFLPKIRETNSENNFDLNNEYNYDKPLSKKRKSSI